MSESSGSFLADVHGVSRCHFTVCRWPDLGIAPVGAVTKACGTLYAPPILCAKPEQAETISVTVKIRLMGPAQLNLSGIAAVR